MINWQEIIKNAELVYSSTSEDIGFRTWSLKKTTCNVSFYEEYPVEDFDKIICNILHSNNNTLKEDKIATILGFNVIDDFENTPKRYSDNAEIEVFRSLIQTVINWGLITKDDIYCTLTELGIKSLTSEKKYQFYTGSKELFENPNLKPVHSDENLFFPFNTELGIYSEIVNKNKTEYDKILLEDVFLSEETNLIQRNKLQSKENYYIFFSEPTHYFAFTSCQVDIRLYRQREKYYPIIFYNDKLSLHASSILHKPQNVAQKNKKIEWGLYLKLINDPNAQLDYQTIIPFEDLLDLDSLIKDKRLIWDDDKLFKFITINSNADQWFTVSNHCPINVLKTYLDKYQENLDWTSLSLRIDNNFLLQNATIYPWNFEVIAAKEDINIEVIKTLLLIPELEENDWNWDVIMPQLDLDFIKTNIDKVHFELTELTKTNIFFTQPLLSQYPAKKWDWIFISQKYDLSYILENISNFSSHLHLTDTVNRVFKSQNDILHFCKSENFIETLNQTKKNKLSSFSPNKSNYLWSETLIDLLENTGYLTWESGKYTLGFECNPHIKWTYSIFSKYRSKISSQKGFNFISEHISNNKIIFDFIDFNWNWDLISTNVELINNSSFVLKLIDKLNINLLLTAIGGETLEIIFEEANILGFLEKHPDSWSEVTEKTSKEFILQNINFDWDWAILTKRFCSTIKIEHLGNVKWVDKWDWKFLTKNIVLNTILENLDLYIDRWDWEYLSQKTDKRFILDNLTEYYEYWNWEFLLSDRIEKEDLKLLKLTEIATCISIMDKETKSILWGIITRKFDYDSLDEIITYKQEIFHWDYSYFYDLPEFSPLTYLNENEALINWSAFSNSKSLNKSLRWNKSLFSYGVWINNVIKLLKTKSYKWNFKSLSKLESINWNSTILKIRTVTWDWEYLSEHSNCFKKDKGFIDRFNEFVKYINFQSFSKRTDSEITEELIANTIDKDWDWKALTSNPSFKFTFDFINNYKQKDWEWNYLSTRNDIHFTNEFLIELSEKKWDWPEISKRTDISFSEELISKLNNKPLNWFLVSQNKTFTPNSKVLSLLRGKELDWISISNNLNLSIEILWNYKELLDWQHVTKNDAIKLSDISFLTKYQDFLDWEYISSSKKFNIRIENLLQFKNKLSWIHICARDDFHISQELLQPFSNVLDWSKVSMSMDIHFTNELIERYRDKWDWQLLRENPKIIERLGTTLKKYQKEFNCVEFLERFDNKPYIYHFTHLFNAIDIIKERKILSRNKGDEKFSNSAGNLVERRDTAHQYARFYFRPQTPTQFYNECLGNDSKSGYLKEWTYNGEHFKRWKTSYPQAINLGLPKCPIPVFFKFDLKEVLMKMPDICYYSTGNMQTNWSKVKKISKEPDFLNISYLYSDVNDYENYKQYSQQEFLIKEEFDFTKLDSFEIICYNEDYANLLKSQLSGDPICKKINSNNWDVFHRGNRELNISQTDSEVTIESEYRDSAYLSIKGEGLKDLKILETANIQKETAHEIIAYPSIKFVKMDKPIEVYFVDTTKGKKDWLIYKN